MTRDNQSTHRDEWLATFADQVLDGKVDDASQADSDPEMRALAETILRLKHAFPKDEPDPASMKRMRAGILTKWRIEKQKEARKFTITLPTWLSQILRPQFAMAVVALAVIVIFAVTAPYQSTGGDPLTGTAGSSTTSLDGAKWLLLGILLVAALWLARRKS